MVCLGWCEKGVSKVQCWFSGRSFVCVIILLASTQLGIEEGGLPPFSCMSKCSRLWSAPSRAVWSRLNGNQFGIGRKMKEGRILIKAAIVWIDRSFCLEEAQPQSTALGQFCCLFCRDPDLSPPHPWKYEGDAEIEGGRTWRYLFPPTHLVPYGILIARGKIVRNNTRRFRKELQNIHWDFRNVEPGWKDIFLKYQNWSLKWWLELKWAAQVENGDSKNSWTWYYHL